MPSKLELLPADITERLELLPERLASFQGLSALWLFGSFARGEATSISDVDLGFLGEGGQDRWESELYRIVSAALRTDEFALVDLQSAPAHLTRRVLAEGRLLVCHDRRAVADLAEKVYCLAPDVLWLRHAGNVDFLEGVEMPDQSIDRDRMTEFLRRISEDLQVLREKAEISRDEYLAKRDVQTIVERRLQTAVESSINIANHLISRLGLRAPQDYADTFGILMEAGVIGKKLAEEMKDLARFRNLLVHLYWRIDHSRVYEGLALRLATLQAFEERIARWLRSLPE